MSREYVNRIDINGKVGYVKETLTGEGPPTEKTVGFVGQRYVDIAAVKEYICAGISVTDGEKRYVWQAGGTMTNVGEPPKILWLERGAPTLYTKGETGMYAFDKHFGFLYAYYGNYSADDTDDGLHHIWTLAPGYSIYNYPPTEDSEGERGQLWADYSACELYMCVGRDIDVVNKKLIYIWKPIAGPEYGSGSDDGSGEGIDILWLDGKPTRETKGQKGMFAFDKSMGQLYMYYGSFPGSGTADGLHHVWGLTAGYLMYAQPPTQDNEGQTGQLWSDTSTGTLYMYVDRSVDPETNKAIHIWKPIAGLEYGSGSGGGIDILWLDSKPSTETQGQEGMFAFDKSRGRLYRYDGNTPNSGGGLSHIWRFVSDYIMAPGAPTSRQYGEWGELWSDYSTKTLYMCVGRDIDGEAGEVIYLWEPIAGAGASLTGNGYAATASMEPNPAKTETLTLTYEDGTVENVQVYVV